MEEKTFKIINNDISDGHHTFGELYQHRCLLFIALVASAEIKGLVYFVKDHYPSWDLLVWESPQGQISYHIPADLRWLYEPILKEKEGSEHKFDGHTSDDVLQRIRFNIMTSRRDDLRERRNSLTKNFMTQLRVYMKKGNKRGTRKNR